jgi:uncharacterized protein (TIGR02145 family)
MERPRIAFILLASSLLACSAEPPQVQVEDFREDASADAGVEAGASSSFVDPRDDQSYATITFGTKTWLARNLNFSTSGSYCHGDAPASCERDGRLYTWTAAQTACPPGTHLGTDAEWKTLETALGMATLELDREGYDVVRGTNEGTKLKDAAGFGARLAGYRTGTTYEARDDRAYFWTATQRGNDVWRRRVSKAETAIFRFTNPPASFAISVRCVLD